MKVFNHRINVRLYQTRFVLHETLEYSTLSIVILIVISKQGIGQALDLARHIANYCNKETRLLPQLFMVAPMRGTIESALLAFPNLSPGSIHSIPWHCSSQFMGLSGDGDSTELTSQFPDIHFDLGTGLNTDSNTDGPSQFLNWLKKRNERVIVGTYFILEK